ncbi:MAG: glycoside hydrolase family 15 protein [Microcystis panniformis]
MLVVHNEKILDFIKYRYSLGDLQRLSAFLSENDVLRFPQLENGLFPAALVSNETEYTGYANVWLRDNVYLAYSHYIIGQTAIAVKNIQTLINYFQKFQRRFINIIQGRVNPEKIRERPHIRFEGRTLTEIDQVWQHAQNDALGYFLWFYCRLAREKYVQLSPDCLETIALFPLYFQAISYWQDEDSGHWEETRKIEASSIGVVVAGLRELKRLLIETEINLTAENRRITPAFLADLIEIGEQALYQILPAECLLPVPQARSYDAALLFLIYPLQVVETNIADQILNNVIVHLQGDYGIRRYLGDSFWCRDYRLIPPEIRTTVLTERENWLQEQGRGLNLGEEAQWCIFDPIISAIFALKFQSTGQEKYLNLQTRYFNRSLGQITGKDSPVGEFKCPELYYLEQGKYIPNDATPLLWTQANLQIALELIKKSLSQ